MNIAELRNHPFFLLVLKDGASDGYFSPAFIKKTQGQLSDMSLRIASDNLSIIYADQIKKACEIVLGLCNLGLLDLCNNDTDKAKEIIKTESIVYCFRAGWAKYGALKKISPDFFNEISLSTYALGINDTSDIQHMHAQLVKEGYHSIKLLEIYKSIATSYSASTMIVDNDEDILKFELQKFFNTAIALLLIGSDKKVFTLESYEQLIDYLSDTDKNVVSTQLETCIIHFCQTLPVANKTYLQEIELLNFVELKKVAAQKNNLDILVQEILELPITVANEINGDFDGGYDFHLDDDEDLAFLSADLLK